MDLEDSLIAFPTREAMAARVGDMLAAVLGRARAERGEGSIAVSGGSTPAPLYEYVARRPVDWARVRVTLVDERWTPPGSRGSNETFVRNSLLQKNGSAADFEGMWFDGVEPDAAASRVEERLKTMTPFSAVVLGIGVDGHTASWFPYAEGLAEALGDNRRVARIRAKPSDVVGEFDQRLTLTLGAIRSADFVCLYMTGDDKRATYIKALVDGPVEAMPVRAIMRARPDMWVCWSA